MDKRLVDFLKDKAVGKDEPFTHTSKIKPMRRYFINWDVLDEFYDIYNQVVADGCIAGITEKPEAEVPLIVDVDFRYNPDRSGEIKRHYKPQHIRDIVGIYHEIIEEIAEKPSPKMFYCCVLEKLNPVLDQGKIKDGFHLHFPYFYTEHWVQKEYIRDHVIQRMQERGILAGIPTKEPLDKIFDKSIPSNCWLMYGSRKEPKAEFYKLTRTYNKDMEILPLKSVFKQRFDKGTKQWNLPRYLSIRQGYSATPLKETIIKKKRIARKKIHVIHRRPLDEIFADLIVAEQLVDMLDDERADDYSKWMEVGWILFNIGEGNQKALDLWINFSGRSEKFQDGVCEKQWEKMEIRNWSLASLKYMACQDSPNEYRAWRDTQINHILQQGISMAHNDIAKILWIMYENQYVCADVEKDIWYEFDVHRWKRVAKGLSLRKHLSNTLVNKYSELASYYMDKFRHEDDQEQKHMYNSKVQLICKLIEKLKNNTFKNCVMKEAMEFFYDDKFIERMDEDKDLLVCENGVYDAANKLFRDGRPDDYCTKSTGLYFHEFDKDDPRVQELEVIFRKIFVDDKLYRFFKQTSSDLVRGGNRHKIFLIWTGGGDNGKSVIADLLERAFGDYYYTPPTTLLMGKQQQSSGATAELLPCKGARVVVVSETDNADILNCGTMKKLTGGDPFYARGLFKDPTKITPQFKLVLHCNKKPQISAEDKASWNRIRVLPYQSTFVKRTEAPKEIRTQVKTKTFPMDKTLKDRLDDLAEAFLWWLIKEYEAFGDDDLYEPPEVKHATDSYQKSNDFYMQFLDERIQETGNSDDLLSLTVIYTLFKVWYKDSYPGRPIPVREQVRDAMEKKMGTPVKGIWTGYNIYDPNGNDSDNEEDEDPRASKKASKIISKTREQEKRRHKRGTH